MNNPLSKEKFLEKLKTDRKFNSKYGRKHNIEGKQVLPPCHYVFQCYTRELTIEERLLIKENKNPGKNPGYELGRSDDYYESFCDNYNIPKRALSLMVNIRSNDLPLGLPFNIASYGLLLEILAKMTNMISDELIITIGDAHIYVNQIDGINEQLTREPYELPKLSISKNVNFNGTIDDMLNSCLINDFQLENYISHSSIKMPLSN
jgi:thymidylate synthase